MEVNELDIYRERIIESPSKNKTVNTLDSLK